MTATWRRSDAGKSDTLTNLDEPGAEVELIPASREQEGVLANLLQPYIHDFSRWVDARMGPDGRFDYPQLPLYWTDACRHALLLKVEGRLIGFALVQRVSETSGNAGMWDMAEFFILRGERRRNLGTEAAHRLWRRFPGRWQIRVMESNIAAVGFWEPRNRAISGKCDRVNSRR